MKTILILIAVFLQTILANGQSLSSSVISTAGDYYTANGNTLSVTIGETMIDNYTSGNANLSTYLQAFIKIHLTDNGTSNAVSTGDYYMPLYSIFE